jgi:translation elongation factor EF-1beta
MEAARQGAAIGVVCKVNSTDGSPDGLLQALNRLDGVQNVQLEDSDVDDD